MTKLSQLALELNLMDIRHLLSNDICTVNFIFVFGVKRKRRIGIQISSVRTSLLIVSCNNVTLCA